MRIVLVLLVFLIIQSFCSLFDALVQRYVGSVGEDEVLYSQLILSPRQGRSMLSIVSEDIDCYLLVGIDHIPTVTDNDYIVRFRRSVLLELSPDDGFGRLFIGIWGGANVNSYRFFAGAPVLSSAFVSLSLGVPETPISCDVALSKDLYNSLTIAINNSNPAMKHLCMPHNVQRLQLSVLGLNSISYDILFQFYFNAPNTKSELYYSTKLAFNSSSNITNLILEQNSVIISVDYPLPGAWTLSTSILFKENDTILVENYNITTAVTIQYEALGLPPQSISAMNIMQYSYNQYVISSLPLSLTSNQTATLLLEVDLTHEQSLMDLLYVAFQVQLKVTTAITNADLAYRLTARAGNIPYDNCNSTATDIILHTNNSLLEQSIQHVPSSHHKGMQQVQFITTFTWTVMRPLIRYLGSTPDVNSLFWRIESLAKNSQAETLQLKIVVTPCPPHACAHGTCLIHEGNIITSSCHCRYPYAGERCNQIAITMSFYSLQVVLLVLSNFAMLPAVLLAFHHRLYVIMVGLITASMSSGVYHLCDMDAICLVNLSFESLHVLDVLFTSGMISMLILFYAPIPPLVHASWSLLILAILIPPTVNDPTNGAVVAIVIIISIAIVLCTWLLWYYQHRHAFGSNQDNRQSKQCWPKNERAINYAQVPHEEDNDSCCSSVADIEMTNHHSPTASMVSNDNAQQANQSGSSEEHKFDQQHPSQERQQQLKRLRQQQQQALMRPNPLIVQILYYSSDSLLSILLVIVGLIIFANESRLDYWYLHSIWHVLMMTAAYFAIRGRFALFQQFSVGQKEAMLWSTQN